MANDRLLLPAFQYQQRIDACVEPRQVILSAAAMPERAAARH
ncbi:hypothetical protein [Stenotrophomonas humi]